MSLRRAALALITTLAVGVLQFAGLPSASASTFSDVPPGAPFAGDIDWLIGQGITTGYRDGTYRPTAPVSRQAMAQFLYRFAHPGAGDPSCSGRTGPFPDVPVSSQFCGAITWLVGIGVTGGYSDGTFKPTAPVSRQAMAQFLYRLSHGSTPAPACTSRPFPDVAPSDASCGAIRWLVAQQVTGGYADHGFHPLSPVSRGAMAAFLHRYWGVLSAHLGADVSYPQCASKGSTSTGPLPSGQAFGVVGVNAGKPTTTNSCFAAELTWGNSSSGGTAQPKVQLYVNTANPGAASSSWPTSGSHPRYDSCTEQNQKACAYEYGWARATEDASTATRPQDYMWWLDVETGNSWDATSGGTGRNVAVLEGMADALTALGAKVGLYSTGYQFGVITGSAVGSTSSLRGLPDWIAGTADVTSAWRNCAVPSLTAGGHVVLTQFIAGGFDREHSCA